MELSQGTNILYGDNAQGKTNILEAVYVCCTTKSHRGAKDKDMIHFGEDESHIKLCLLYTSAGQPCTFKHTVLFQCFNGVLRTRRCVNTVSVSFKRRKIFLVSSYHQDHRLFYDLHFQLHFDSFKI